eukprot:TRINITY_DN4368_c0_g2_i1.p1 TRINITY_DN4368_c0_g2~~TRINITY_DN4368_c0_g2_i1.p1  ORF type:complete len:508 (+),score=46.60 TRINITY_DN4368_c0_g2_i1:559-2082(+)
MGTSLRWSQNPLTPSSPPAIKSIISSPSYKRRTINNRSSMIYSPFKTGILRSQSCGNLESKCKTLRRSCSASLDRDQKFGRRFQEFDLRFHRLAGEEHDCGFTDSDSSEDFSEMKRSIGGFRPFESAEPPWAVAEEDEMSIERKANSVDLPLSLRILQRKRQWQERFRAAGESACCSVKKAFASLVFIIRELQSYTLQMRESLFYGDLQEILDRVHDEMHASFVCLFQQIFSHTPALMVSVMILLANFTVHSMGNGTAIAAVAPPPSALMETVSTVEDPQELKFDSLSAKTFSVSVGGGGGGKVAQPVAGPTDGGDEQSRQMVAASTWDRYRRISPEEATMVLESEEEVRLWESVVEEASRMRAEVEDESLDHETLRMLVSPVTVEMEPEDYDVYLRTELVYQRAVTEEPQNPLVLCNYAQFLYLVARNFDWAEEFFKRAIRVEPPDAHSLNRYAYFLWLAREDLGAAEETFLRAVEVDPSNTYYGSSYANFLWHTGGKDTCFPLCC